MHVCPAGAPGIDRLLYSCFTDMHEGVRAASAAASDARSRRCSCCSSCGAGGGASGSTCQPPCQLGSRA